MSKTSHNSSEKLSHIDANGSAQMVNVASKPIAVRTAVASAICLVQPPTGDAIRSNTLVKGDVLAVARLAGIQAAKRTDELIPLCHSLPLDGVEVQFEWLNSTELKIFATVSATARTGVEMEALMAASVAGLTIYDMCKAIDRTIRITQIQLESKTGGTRGDFHRSESKGSA